MTFGVKSQKVDIVALVGGGRARFALQHSLTALSATLQTLHHDNIGHLDIWTLVTWRHVSTHWTLDTQATLLVEGDGVDSTFTIWLHAALCGG